MQRGLATWHRWRNSCWCRKVPLVVPLPWYGVRTVPSVSGTPERPRLLSPPHKPGWAAIFGATLVTAPGICH
jgi:hypothetical protein